MVFLLAEQLWVFGTCQRFQPWLMGLTRNRYSACVFLVSLGKTTGCTPNIKVLFPWRLQRWTQGLLEAPKGALQPKIRSLALVVLEWGMEELLGWRDGCSGEGVGLGELSPQMPGEKSSFTVLLSHRSWRYLCEGLRSSDCKIIRM